MFESHDLEALITVDKGFLFYLLESKTPGTIGPVVLSRGLWYAQVRDNGVAETIDQLDLQSLLNDMAGFSFNKKKVSSTVKHFAPTKCNVSV
jgi:hypothetical protein